MKTHLGFSSEKFTVMLRRNPNAVKKKKIGFTRLLCNLLSTPHSLSLSLLSLSIYLLPLFHSPSLLFFHSPPLSPEFSLPLLSPYLPFCFFCFAPTILSFPLLISHPLFSFSYFFPSSGWQQLPPSSSPMFSFSFFFPSSGFPLLARAPPLPQNLPPLPMFYGKVEMTLWVCVGALSPHF